MPNPKLLALILTIGFAVGFYVSLTYIRFIPADASWSQYQHEK